MNLPPAGWYPDPERPGQARWWDGGRWFVPEPTLPPPPPGSRPGPPPPSGGWGGWGGWQQPIQPLLDDEETSAKWAKVAVWAAPLSYAFTVLAVGQFFEGFVDDIESGTLERRFEDQSTFGADYFVETQLWSGVLSLVGLLGTLSTVALVLWAYRVTSLGERLGRPLHRSPGWTVAGFFIPIVNFWFPYQGITDSLAPRTARGPILAWWVLHMSLPLSYFVVFFVVLFGGSAGPLFIAALAVALIVGVLGMRTVDLVLADHRAGVAAR